MAERPAVAFDTETTGLIKLGRTPGIVQIGIIRATMFEHGGQTWFGNHEKREWLLDPELDKPTDWEEDAIKITGIGPKEVEGAPTFLAVFDEIVDLFIGCEVVLGYNLGYDVEVLAGTLRKYGLAHHFPWPRNHIDVLPLATARLSMIGKRGNKPPTLGEAYAHYSGTPLADAHSALPDIEATLYVAERVMSAVQPETKDVAHDGDPGRTDGLLVPESVWDATSLREPL